MKADNERQVWIQEIDAALKEWCQGDYVLGEHLFFQRCDPRRPITKASKDAVEEGVDLVESEVRALL